MKVVFIRSLRDQCCAELRATSVEFNSHIATELEHHSLAENYWILLARISHLFENLHQNERYEIFIHEVFFRVVLVTNQTFVKIL